MKSSWKRLICALAAIVLAVVCVPMARADDIEQAQQRSQTVRVYLSRLGLTDRMDITLASPYGVKLSSGEALRFPAGSELAVLLRDAAIYLYYEGMSMEIGQTFTLARYGAEGEGESGFRLTNYPALYAGDLTIDISDGKIRPILSVHVEDYLLGVVPYEMSNSFPLEALKAQAVAARTYALRKQSPNAAYDVVDTTNDQVYRGYLPGNTQVERAIAETRGVCGFYKGLLAQCYYSASNGGQTELVGSVWPTDQDFGYYAFGDDPYDVANPASTVRSFEIGKTYRNADDAPYALRKLLAAELGDMLLARGFDADAASVRVDEVSAVSLDTPNTDGSKLMTMLHVTLKVSGRTRTDISLLADDPDTEEVSLFLVTDASSPTPAPTGLGFLPVQTVMPSPTPAPSYGPFTPIEESITLDLPVFPTVEDAFSLDISANYDNEIWSVRETSTSYVIEARRYGHGVGMSQRGAQWMAAVYQMKYQDILAFYYPGLTLMNYPEEAPALLIEEESLSMTPGPAPSPTPRPTLMPATLEAAPDQWYATVTGIDADSSLNLRATPNLNGNIAMRLYKGQRLLVLERCPEEGWVKVKTDVAEGYVMVEYLTAEDENAVQE